MKTTHKKSSVKICGRAVREFGYGYNTINNLYASFNTFWISLRPSSFFQKSSVSSSLA